MSYGYGEMVDGSGDGAPPLTANSSNSSCSSSGALLPGNDPGTIASAPPPPSLHEPCRCSAPVPPCAIAARTDATPSATVSRNALEPKL